VEEIKRHISDFLNFIEKPSDKGKYELLEKHLSTIYSKVLNLQNSFERSTGELKSIDYIELRKRIQINFQELGFYHIILNADEITAEPELAIGDAIDDLTDIVKDLKKEVMSLSDKETFLWQLHFKFIAHFKEHLVSLMYYLNEFKG